MNLLLELLIRAKWWMHAALAVGCVALGVWLEGYGESAKEELAQALAAPAPEPISLDEYDRSVHDLPFDEIRVWADINTDYNTNLIERTNGVKTDETTMYVLFEPYASPDAKVVKAVLMVDPDDVDRYVDLLINGGGDAFSFDIHGTVSTYHSQGSHAKEVLEEKYGLTPASGMLFIEPFMNGRESGLTAEAGQRQNLSIAPYFVAAVFALFAVVRGLFDRAFRKPKAPKPGPVGALAPVSRGLRAPLGGEAELIAGDKICDDAWANPLKRQNPFGAGAPEAVSQPIAKPGPEPAPEGQKLTRAAKLEAKRLAALAEAQQEEPAQRPMTALEKARAFRAKASSGPSRQDFKAKMKEDPFAKLSL